MATRETTLALTMAIGDVRAIPENGMGNKRETRETDFEKCRSHPFGLPGCAIY
jgi:hypothetical protein